MVPPHPSPSGASARWVRLAAGAAALAVAVLMVVPIVTKPDRWQWDLGVYWHAVRAKELGLDPYGDLRDIAGFTRPLPFVYPPLALALAKPLTLVDAVTAGRIFLVLKLLAAAGLLRLLAVRFLRDGTATGQAPRPQPDRTLAWSEVPLAEGRTVFFLFALTGMGGALWADFRCGNVSTFEQWVLWGGFALLISGRLAGFCLCVVAIATFKIVPVVFLSALLLTRDPRRFRFLTASLLLLGLVLAAQAVVAPAEFAGFVRNASEIRERGADSNPSSLALVQDLADGLGAAPGVAGPCWLVLAGAVVGAAAWHLQRRRLDGSGADAVAIGFLCATAAVALPRMKTYSFVLLLLPAYLAARHVARGRRPVLLTCLALLSLSDAPPAGLALRALGLDLDRETGWLAYLPLLMAGAVWACLADAVRRSGATQAGP